MRQRNPATDRMPPIPASKMTPLQKKYAEVIIKGPRKGLVGPFVPLLRSPELMNLVQRMGLYLRYKSAIGNRLSEFVILLVSRRWTQRVEWQIHEPIAVQAGIAPRVVKAIAEGRRPASMAGDEAVVYDFLDELNANQCVSDVTYERALELLGAQGVIDLIAINGYYTLLAMVMNTTRTPPSGKAVALPSFPD
jgi:4-carboxymuconolactone decarboxylase